MFRWILFLHFFLFFLPFLAQAKKTQIKKKVLNERKLSADKNASLMELLNDANKLKNEIKRDLAEKTEEQPLKSPRSKKKIIRFGNMKLSISERKEEELKKPSPKN